MAISSLSASTAISYFRTPDSRTYNSYSSNLLSFSSAPLLNPDRLSNLRISSPSSSPSLIVPKVCRRSLPLLVLESAFQIAVSAKAILQRDASSVSETKETIASLDELLQKSEKAVLVDFYAIWCGPCQFMVPILEEVSSIMNDAVQVVKIDTQKDVSIADQYGIRALPTFILFRDGKPVDRFEGALPRDKLIERIESSLNTNQS